MFSADPEYDNVRVLLLSAVIRRSLCPSHRPRGFSCTRRFFYATTTVVNKRNLRSTRYTEKTPNSSRTNIIRPTSGRVPAYKTRCQLFASESINFYLRAHEGLNLDRHLLTHNTDRSNKTRRPYCCFIIAAPVHAARNYIRSRRQIRKTNTAAYVRFWPFSEIATGRRGNENAGRSATAARQRLGREAAADFGQYTPPSVV